MLLPILGAIGGGLKFLLDKNNEAKDRHLQAETARYSPWTGMSPQPVKRANPFDVVAGGAAGLSFEQANPNLFGGADVTGTAGGGYGGANLGVDTDLPGAPGGQSQMLAGGPGLGANTNLGSFGLPTLYGRKNPYSLLAEQ